MVNNPGRAVIIVISLTAAVCFINGVRQYVSASEKETYQFHHELATDADSSIGTDVIPEDYIVGEDFTSHLPLIILDPHGQEIVNYKYYDTETDSFRYQDGVDPYTDVSVQVIDNVNHVNTLSDTAAILSEGRIKIRGNSSSTLPKSQYRLQLLDEDGNKTQQPLLGLDPAAEWVLNGSLYDHSYLRNYLGYNLGHIMDACSPEVRFCEILVKTEEGYRYDGLYLLIETIGRGEGRVNIQKYNPDITSTAFIVRRDRVDNSEIRIRTYADETVIAEKWARDASAKLQLSLIYPGSSSATQETIAYISEDISRTEKIIYAEEDSDLFKQYPSYIDVDSFVNYFLINELLMNYDSGIYSTYMYKELNGKLTMGPVWDFDSAVDNATDSLADFEYMVMKERPYFERLCKDKWFIDKLSSRYRQLRRGVLSDANISKIVEDTGFFLGRAIDREYQRWGNYFHEVDISEEENTGLYVDRNRQSYENEVTKLQDALLLHAEYLDEHLDDRDNIIVDNAEKNFPALLFLVIFFVSIVLVQRARKM